MRLQFSNSEQAQGCVAQEKKMIGIKVNDSFQCSLCSQLKWIRNSRNQFVLLYFLDDVDTAEYGCSEDTTQSDSPPEQESQVEDTGDDPLLQDEQEKNTMSAGEPHAGTPPLHNHINTTVLNQLKQKFEEVPESIMIKVLKEVMFLTA